MGLSNQCQSCDSLPWCESERRQQQQPTETHILSELTSRAGNLRRSRSLLVFTYFTKLIVIVVVFITTNTIIIVIVITIIVVIDRIRKIFIQVDNLSAGSAADYLQVCLLHSFCSNRFIKHTIFRRSYSEKRVPINPVGEVVARMERLLLIQVAPNAPPIFPTTARDDLLDAFVYPLGRSAFSSCFGRRPVAFVGGGAARVRRLLDSYFEGGDVSALTEASPSEGISAWLRPATGTGKKRADGGGGAGGAGKAHSTTKSVKVAPDVATALHEAGASLYFRAPPRTAATLVPMISESVGLIPAALYYETSQATPRGEVEVFVTRAGHETGWHTDFQQNFTIQLTGSKRWRLVPGACVPLRARTPHFDTPAAAAEEQRAAASIVQAPDAPFYSLPPPDFLVNGDIVTLRAGDVLHFPAGAWHAVSASEDSISVNISLVGLSWADLATAAVRTALWREASMRQIVSGIPPGLQVGTVSGAGAGKGATAEARKRAKIDLPITTKIGNMLSSQKTANVSALTGARAALASLQAVVAALTPESLLPPSAFISRRFADLPGCDAPGASDEEEEEEEEGEKEGGSSSEGEGGGTQEPAPASSFEDGDFVVTIDKRGPKTSPQRGLMWNTNCVLLRGSEDTIDAEFIAIVGLGVPSGEEITPLCRTLLRVSRGSFQEEQLISFIKNSTDPLKEAWQRACPNVLDALVSAGALLTLTAL